ncbi:MAG TPA: zinc-dependent peptidase [Spirochaetales bacterium]|nr:zinc-dependent peptidase [Spirochaetales bacterium]HPM71708.1 zinc-dependent peptidase [Spirochaetales bacterium]
MGIFSFLRRRRPGDYDELRIELWDAVRAGRPAFASLTPEDCSALRRMASWFIDVKDFVALGGVRVDEGDEATIALLACLPVLRLGAGWYDDWSTILAAPDGFVHRMTSVDGAGVVTEYDDLLSGRVTELGPVLFSLPDVRESGFGDGYNVVVHEMAHKLDERDGGLDGCPPLPRSMSRRAWRAAFGDAYADFQVRVARSSSGRRVGRASRLPLDEYAAESPDEFFAVACEAFFDAPQRLEAAYPEVYELLGRFFSGGA